MAQKSSRAFMITSKIWNILICCSLQDCFCDVSYWLRCSNLTVVCTWYQNFIEKQHYDGKPCQKNGIFLVKESNWIYVRFPSFSLLIWKLYLLTGYTLKLIETSWIYKFCHYGLSIPLPPDWRHFTGLFKRDRSRRSSLSVMDFLKKNFMFVNQHLYEAWSMCL